jgi:hypothetical protein
LFLTNQEDSTIVANTGILYLVSPGATGPTFPDQAHLDRVRAQFTRDDGTAAPYPMISTQQLKVLPAPFLDIDVAATIFLRKNTTGVPQAQYEASVAAAVRASLKTFLSPTNADGSLNTAISFAYYLRTQSSAVNPVGLLAESDIADAIHDASPGVREIDPSPTGLSFRLTRRFPGLPDFLYPVWATRQDILVEAPASDLGPSGAANFPRLGSVLLTNGDTRLAI